MAFLKKRFNENSFHPELFILDGIKSTKIYLKKILANASLNYEEFYTALTQTEAILNSKLLTPSSNKSMNFEPSRPGHLLLRKPLTLLPEENLTVIKESTLFNFKKLSQ